MKLDFEDSTFVRIIIGIVVIMTLINFYDFFTGSQFAIIPLSVQLSFLFLFAIDHHYQKPVGYVLFGLILVAGVAGLVGSCSRLAMMSLDASRESDLSLQKIMLAISLTVFGSLSLQAIKRQKVDEVGKIKVSDFLKLENTSWKLAMRDAVIIRIVIFMQALLLGAVLSLLGKESIVPEITTFLNTMEYLALIVYTSIALVVFGKEPIAQSIMIFFYHLLILILIKFSHILLVLAIIYQFFLMAFASGVYCLLWVKLRQKVSPLTQT